MLPPASRTRLVGLLAAVAIGLGAGVATSYLQGVLPSSADFLANSGAVWTLVAFLIALWSADRVRAAAAAGLLGLLGEVLGYYAIAAPIRHIATGSRERVLWTVGALVIGSIAGWLAFHARHGLPAHRAAAAGAVCGVIAGEGAYALIRLSHRAQGWIELLVAVVALAATAGRLARSWPDRLASVAPALVAAALVYAAYNVA